MAPRRLLLCLASATIALATLPASASAAELRAPGCVNSLAPLELRAMGFAPGSTVSFLIDAILAGSAQADSDGSATLRTQAPAEPGRRELELAATDGVASATATPALVFPFVELDPQAGFVSERVRLTGRGFPAGKRLFLHYLKGREALDKRKLGRSRGPCGEVSRQGELMDFRGRREGKHRLVVLASKRYRASIRPQGTLRVDYGAKVGDDFEPRPAFVNPSNGWLERR